MDAGQVGEESKAGAELGLANLADGGSGVIDEPSTFRTSLTKVITETGNLICEETLS